MSTNDVVNLSKTSFQTEILARNDGAAIGQMGSALGQIVRQFLHRTGEDRQG